MDNPLEELLNNYCIVIKNISEKYNLNLNEPAQQSTENYKKIAKMNKKLLVDILEEIKTGKKGEDMKQYITTKLNEFDNTVSLTLNAFIDLHKEYLRGIKNGQTD